MAASASVEEKIAQTILQAASTVEAAIDEEIQKLSNADDSELEEIRRRRMQELKAHAQQREEWQVNDHGTYCEISNEREFFDVSKRSSRVVCHFYDVNVFKCRIVDKHLNMLAYKHFETKFIKINAEKAPFLMKKLNIRCLPTVAVIKQGKIVDYLKTFNELGSKDDVNPDVLESRLVSSGAVFKRGDMLASKSQIDHSKNKSLSDDED